VAVAAGDVELGPNARLAGRLRYVSTNALKRDPAAQVAGAVERGESPSGAAGVDARDVGAAFGLGTLLWSLGLALLAALLMLGLPGVTGRAVARARGSTLASVALGFALLASLPLLALLAAITIVGLPFALLVVLSYPALLMLGYACGLIAASDALLARLAPARANAPGWRIAALIVVALLLTLVGWVPLLGWLPGLLVLAAGLGALLRVLWSSRGER
jgi:hypothetical protein